MQDYQRQTASVERKEKRCFSSYKITQCFLIVSFAQVKKKEHDEPGIITKRVVTPFFRIS